MAEQNQLVRFIRNDSIQQRIESLLDKRASQFTTSLITIANTNTKIANCRPDTVLNAALTAASMDLPLNPNLGFAYIVPYGNEAQFQMGWKGYVQLAQRSGRYKTISATPVYEGQLLSNDPLRGIKFDWSVPADGDAVGYVAYFELLNGFEKTLYMSADEMKKHATRYSKAFKSGPWQTDYDKMAMKTVLKLLINRFGPMSTEIENAILNDQAVITDDGRKYVDGKTDLDDVNATDDEQNDILNANGVPEGVDPETGEITEDDDDEAEAIAAQKAVEAQDGPPGEDRELAQEVNKSPNAKPKVNVKEEAAKRWAKPKTAPESKQASLVDDQDS